MGKAIICDIDGVLVDNSLILNHIKSNNLVGEEKWKYINSHINGLDTYPNRKMMELIKMFYLKDFKIILLTARSEEIREQTIRTIENDFFLLTDLIIEFDIYMRKLEDYDLKPHEIKQKYLEKLKQEYDIYCAFDDEEENCNMFKNNGILTFKVIGAK